MVIMTMGFFMSIISEYIAISNLYSQSLHFPL